MVELLVHRHNSCSEINMEFASVTFSDSYTLDKSNYDSKEIKKLEESIFIHGSRGASKKKHNSVVPIRPTDSKFWKFLESFKFTNRQFPVKVVAHVPSGNRLIGYIEKLDDDESLSLHILGVCQY